MFSSVAKNYDAMNDLMSGGVHRLWKQAMIDWLAPGADTQLVDVAGGTGDIAFRFLDRAAPKNGADRVTVCDINADMLNVGAERATAREDRNRLAFVCGNAENLPFTSGSADAYTIAFGIRNVTHIDRALSEAYRTLRPGGRFAIAGAIAGPMAEIDLRTLYLKDLTMFGCTFQEDVVFENLIRYIEAGEIRPVVARTYSLVPRSISL